jgi:hypothetical protein
MRRVAKAGRLHAPLEIPLTGAPFWLWNRGRLVAAA